MDVPAAQVFFCYVVTHGMSDDGRPCNEELRYIAHHHGEMAEHRFCCANPNDAPQEHVHDGDSRKLFGVHRAAEVPRKERTAATGDTRPPGLDRAGALACAAIALRLLGGHHRSNATATRRAIEQANRWREQVQRKAIQVAAFRPDRAVRMAAAGGEVVGADDRRAAVNLPPAADVVRGREIGDAPFVVVGREARHAADLSERAVIKQQFDALAAGELATASLAHHTRIERAGGEPRMGDALERGDLVEDRRPRLVGGEHLGPGGAGLDGGRREHNEALPGYHVRTGGNQGQRFYNARTRRQHHGLHLHRVQNDERRALAHGIALLHGELDEGGRERAGHHLLARQDVERRYQWRAGCRGSASNCRPLLFQQREWPGAVALRSGADFRCLREQRRSRLARAEGRIGENAAKLAQVRGHTSDVELAQRLQRAVYRRGE